MRKRATLGRLKVRNDQNGAALSVETYTGDRGVDLLECARAAQQPLRAAIVRDPFDVAAETYLLETISHRFKTPTSFIC